MAELVALRASIRNLRMLVAGLSVGLVFVIVGFVLYVAFRRNTTAMKPDTSSDIPRNDTRDATKTPVDTSAPAAVAVMSDNALDSWMILLIAILVIALLFAFVALYKRGVRLREVETAFAELGTRTEESMKQLREELRAAIELGNKERKKLEVNEEDVNELANQFGQLNLQKEEPLRRQTPGDLPPLTHRFQT